MNSRSPGFFTSRQRVVLLIAIVILVVALIALLGVLTQLLTPKVITPTRRQADGEIEWVRSMYGFGSAADEQLAAPTSVAIAPNGDVYVTDPTRARVMVFRSDGTFRRMLQNSTGGEQAGGIVHPESLAIDGDGTVYIADSRANKIIVFDDNGTFLREWPVQLQARGVSVDEGKVYVLDVGRVLVYTTDGASVSSFGTRGPGVGQIDAYQGIVARDGVIYVADSFNKRLQAFDESGKVIWTVPAGDAGRSGPSNEAFATGDGSGTGDAASHRWDLPQDLVFDGNGRLIVVDAFTFELAVVDPRTGLVSATYGEFGRADGRFLYPTSVAYDPQRDWFAVADTQNNRVQIVRIPDSSGSGVSAVWRAASSPYRYLLVPGLLLLVSVVVGAIAGRRTIVAAHRAEKLDAKR